MSLTRFAVAVAVTSCLVSWMLFSKAIPDFISGNNDRCKFVEVAKSKRVNDYRGKCFVVLGGTDGVGKAMMQRITKELNGKVIISGRTKAKLDAVDAEEKASGNRNYLGGVPLNLLEPKSVAQFAATIRDELVPKHCPESKLGYLIMNAGMIYTTSHNETRLVTWDDGNVYDGLFAANFVGDLALVSHLLPLLKSSKTKIVVVSSNVYPMGYDRHVLNPSEALYDPVRREAELEAVYAGTRYKRGVKSVHYFILFGKIDGVNNLMRYGSSKLAANALGYELLQKHGLDVVVGSPGAVATGMTTARGVPRENQFSWYDASGFPILMSPAESAAYVLDFLPFAEEEARAALKSATPRFFAPAYLMEKAPHDTIYDYVVTWQVLELLQRFTMRPGYVWMCDAESNVGLPDSPLRAGMRTKYFSKNLLKQ